MAKPKKSGDHGESIIENPITTNFSEGLSILEYFISTLIDGLKVLLIPP